MAINGFSWLKMLAVGTGIGLLSAPAQAQFTSFATFTSLGGNAFQFNNNGASSFLSTNTGSAIPVSFTYLTSNGTGLVNTTISATMTVTATASGALIGGVSQPMNGITLAFIADTPIGGQTNLLTLSSSTGNLTKTGSTTATLAGTQGGGGIDTVTFTSDFLGFGSTTVRDFSISNTGITPSITTNVNGFWNTFTATASTGSFSSNPAPTSSSAAPEPTTVALLILGGFGIARRRRH